MIGDRYAVIRTLGRGGMATVYLCTDKVTGDKVAVKVLREELGSAVIVERFLREIAFASELDHERIPKVLDSGVMGELPFYVMTFVEGESLRERLDRVKQLPVEEAIRIALAVIEPMTYAHRMGIVHRDIKPGNILVGDEAVHVLDFGIARAILVSADESLTSTGVALGTPAYMSPEQALADADLDARSDLYSLACVVYEMIAGIPPFVGATAQAVMARRFAAPPPPLAHVREGVPPHLDAAVMKGLCRAPADRWQTARQFADALSPPAGQESTQQLRHRTTRRRKLLGRGIAITIAASAVTAAAFAGSRISRDAVTTAQALVGSWDFDGADSSLRAALARDPGDARAHLWLAQVMMLQGDSAARWKNETIAAAEKRLDLTPIEQRRLDALLALAAGRVGTACALFEDLRFRDRSGAGGAASASLAYADCLLQDQTVVPVAGRPTELRFLSSYHAIDSIYGDLLEHNARESAAYRALMPRLEKVLAVDKRMLRRGLLEGTGVVYAQPALRADTIAYVPRVASASGATVELGSDVELENAIRRNQARLREFAERWVELAPREPAPHEALARYLESEGILEGPDRSALAEIVTARRLSSPAGGGVSVADRVTMAASHVRILMRLGRYGDVGPIADSILAVKVPTGIDPREARDIEQIHWRFAALRGRIHDVVRIEQRYAPDYQFAIPGGIERPPRAIALDAIALANYGAFGAPRDSIAAVAERLDGRLRSLIAPSKLKAVRRALIMRPLSLASPVIGTSWAATLEPISDPVTRILRAHAIGDRASALDLLDSLRDLHADRAPGEITMDVTYLEAWLASELRDVTGAAALLDNALSGISRAPPSMLRTPLLTASLVRALILRSELAGKINDGATMTRYAESALQLWGEGHPELVEKIRRLKEPRRLGSRL